MLRDADGDLLASELATRFVIADAGRLLYENDAERSPVPRLYLAGYRVDNVIGLRHDVEEGIALAI